MNAVSSGNEEHASDLQADQHPLSISDPKRWRRFKEVEALYDSGHPLTGTLGETYFLEGRGLEGLELPAELRFTPEAYHSKAFGKLPAILAPMRRCTGEPIIAVQAIFLAPDGMSKAQVDAPRKVYGAARGSATWLSPVSGVIIIAESIEKALAIRAATGLPVASAYSAGNLPSVTPPDCAREVIVAADLGDIGQLSAIETAYRLAAARDVGRTVKLAQPPNGLDAIGKPLDWDSAYRLLGRDAVAKAISIAEVVHGESGDGDHRLSIAATVAAYESICVADIDPKHIEWFWDGYMARGKITILAGQPGQGKSQFCAYLAACTSRGKPFVDGKACPKGSVIFIACEDDVADTVRPRLDAVHADLSKIHVLQGVRKLDKAGASQLGFFDLGTGLDGLRRLIEELGDVALVVIDPVSAYLGGVDSYKESDVRGLLMPLQVLAAEANVAVVLVSHLNKSTGRDALSRVSGSGAFAATARSAFLIVRDRTNPERRLFLNLKNNIGPDLKGLSFTVEQVIVPPGIKTSRVVLDPTPVAVSADQALEAASAPPTDTTSALQEAKDFLRDVLKDGPKPAAHTTKAAKDEGIAEKTLNRARRELKIVITRTGFGRGGASMWSLPPAN